MGVQPQIFRELLSLIGLQVVLYAVGYIVVSLMLQPERIIVLLPAYLRSVNTSIVVVVGIGDTGIAPDVNVTVNIVIAALSIWLDVTLGMRNLL